MPNPRSTAPDPYVPTYYPGYGLYWTSPRGDRDGRKVPLEDGARLDDATGGTGRGGNEQPWTHVSSTSGSGPVVRRAVKPGRCGRKRKRGELGEPEAAEMDGIDDRAGEGEGFGPLDSGRDEDDGGLVEQNVHDGGGGRACDYGDHDELESVSSSSHGASMASQPNTDRTGRVALPMPTMEARGQVEGEPPTPASSSNMLEPISSSGSGPLQAASSAHTTARARAGRPRRNIQRSISAVASASPSTQATQSHAPLISKAKAGNKRKRAQPHTHSAEEVILVPHGLAPIHTAVDPHWLHLFFRFCSERHTMQDKREAGVPRDKLSEDETMRKSFVGNVYRELDRGSVRVKDEVIGVGEQSVEEVCFRLFLYCGFHEYSTWTTLVAALGHVPRWSTFMADLPIYERALHTRSFHHRKTLYTSGFQLVPPTRYYGLCLPHYAATLRFVKSLMDSGLPHRLMRTRFAVDASHLLQSFPTLGPFLSLGILCYLNDSAGFKWFWRDFASCGPGARGYLQKIFGKGAINSVAAEEAGLRWLRENQWVIWKRLGVDPPYAKAIKGIRPGLRCLDIENALCWCHRYVVDYTKNGWGSLADMPLPARTEVGRTRVKREHQHGAVEQACDGGDGAIEHDAELEANEPAWCEREEDVGASSKAVHQGDYDEVKERLPPTEEGEEVYEVEKIVCRKGQRGGKDGLFRVRWKGWAPEDDTWERASSLKGGADEALQEWLDWEETVWASIERVKDELPWTRPVGLGEDVKEEQGDEEVAELDPDPESERRRARRGRPSKTSSGLDAAASEHTVIATSHADVARPEQSVSPRASPTSRMSREGDHDLTPAGTAASTATPASVSVMTPVACEASRMEVDVDAAVKEEPC